jgi:aminoglycoside phosphotransferase (APT) family kinase protein
VAPSEAQTVESLGPWLAARLDAESVALEDLRRHVEGWSWETYTFTAVWTDRGGTAQRQGLALRREPEDGLLAPYDIAGQYALHAAVARETALPMPRLRWLELDRAPLGMPFYVMDRVDGAVPVQWRPDDPEAFPTEAARRSVGEQFVDALAALHSASPAALGHDPGPRDPVAAALAEVDHWHERYDRHAVRRVPLLEEAAAWLRANVAVSGRTVLCHGDYRIGNFMLDADHRINAIFDWELAHVSDPVEDIAWAGLPLFRGRSPRWSHLLEADDFLARYRERTGLTVEPPALRFWTVLCYLKASATYIRAARAYEDGRGDLRLAVMGHEIQYVLQQLRRQLRAADGVVA